MIEIPEDTLQLVVNMIHLGDHQGAADKLSAFLPSQQNAEPTPVAVAAFRRGDRYLIARRKYFRHLGGLWEFPGGSVREDETLENGLKRQIKEELGVDITVHHKVGQSTHQYPDCPPIKITLFTAGLNSSNFHLNDHDQVEWLTLQEIREKPLVPADKSLFNQLMTHHYYSEEAIAYAAETLIIDIASETQAICLATAPPAKILDLGCGSGRDTLYFRSKGYEVTPVDSSPAMCQLAAVETQSPVIPKNVLSLGYDKEFDAIWASACLPHIPKNELNDALTQCMKALKPGGLLYFSLKSGEGEGIDPQGRFTARYTREEIEHRLQSFPCDIVSIWSSQAARRNSNEIWLNVIITHSE